MNWDWRGYWKLLVDRMHAPPPSSEEERVWRKMRDQLPTPIFWLLGKTQSGKTSIIRALTGEDRAEIGNGFQPCTRTAQIFDFPPGENPVLRFLDTRGLGESAYDPTEDLNVFAQQAHLLIVVMKAMDHAQQPVLDPLREIHRTRPDWPIVVVQTSLHEGYPDRKFSHLQPYPFQTTPLPPTVPAGLARSLLSQREMFVRQTGIEPRFIPIDFTLPEDGYTPVDYGLDPLWEEMERLLPLGLRGMLMEDRSLHNELRDITFRAAHRVVISHALTAGGAALMPVPVIDLPAVIGIQARMCHEIAEIYHQDLNGRRLAELLGALGLGFVVRLGGRELLKLIPGVGSSVAAVYAAATTYALGLSLCAYMSQINAGAIPQPEEFRRIYETYYAEGLQNLRAYLKRR